MNVKIKMKWLVVYLATVLLLFATQSYVLYFIYIPDVLVPFAKDQVLHAHLEGILYTLARFGRIWFAVLVASVIGLVIGAYIRTRVDQRRETFSKKA